MDDERVITIDQMPGWDNYTPTDIKTTRLAKTPQLNGPAMTTGIFDMNGHYMGKNLNVLPQGRYIVRSKIQGHAESTLYIKK
jgi:hypothetical protein